MPDIPAPLAAALAGRYTIERELGRGGNAVVYLAHDPKHGRKVALKVLSPELAVRSERFLREIGIASKLSHPHILTLIDSGQAGGFLYYVMPYVDGESLRDRLMREKQLPVEDALRITREVAEALGHAHQQRVVHRDIKPENILLHGGHAVVMDFGIARALTAAGGQTVTETDIAVGTPAYMSPEQGAGSGELDARSDVYSLGCVLYEMLVGHPPYTGATAQEILARHALDPVPSLRTARPDVPEGIERSVAQSLAKVPVARFATAAAFAAALAARPGEKPSRRPRALVYGALGLGVLLAGYVVATRTDLGRPAGPAASAHSVAVLPFVNLSGDTAYEYFSDGMTEELIDALVQVPGLQVPARTSAFVFKGKTGDIREIGRRLNVATVVEGTVRRSGSRLRVSAQLIKVADGYHLWSSTYERELRDVFVVQDEIARAIVSALKLKLAVVPSRPENLEAYQLYLKGRLFLNKGTEDGLNRALEFFGAAIAQDSGYARAYAGLADAYSQLIIRGQLRRADAYPRARAAALRAVALDSQLAEAYTARGQVRFRHEWDWAGADQDFRRALALNPAYANGHARYGVFLGVQGRSDEGIREARRAADLDPLSAQVLFNYHSVLLSAGQYGPAAEQARKALELEPSSQGHVRLGDAYLLEGRFADAIRELQTARRLLGDRGQSAAYMARLGFAYALGGRRQEAIQMLDQLKALAASSNPPGGYESSLAELYGVLGENDQAFAWLERAYQEHDYRLTNLRVLRFYDPLRSDPRFTQLLKKVGLGA